MILVLGRFSCSKTNTVSETGWTIDLIHALLVSLWPSSLSIVCLFAEKALEDM